MEPYCKMLINLYLLVTLALCTVGVGANDEILEQMKESELLDLLKEENNIIVLFCKNEDCTGKAIDFESSLVSVREELVEETNAWVIKSHAPSQSLRYGLKDSAIIFIRSGAPLLYTGPSDDELKLLRYFVTNKESSVHHLNDKTFEHQTQVATGATTGDWFVMFVKLNCEGCQEMMPTIEAVAANLKGKKNVAIVNRDQDGGVTTRRFGIKTFPSFIFFRLGRMYRVDIPIVDVVTLTSFAEDGFHNAQKLDIPTPKSPFDDVVEAAVDWLKENPSTFIMSVGGVILAVAILIALNRPPPESWAKQKKKKH